MNDKPKVPPQLTPFPKGVSGNPGGRKPMTAAEKKLRKLSKEQFKEVGDMIVTGKMEDLHSIQLDPNATVLQKLVASALEKAHEKGDWHVVNLLLDRLIGKVREDIAVQLAVPTIIKRLSGEEIEYGSKLIDGEKSDDDEKNSMD